MSKFPKNFRAFSATFQPVSFTGSSILGKLDWEHSVNSVLRFCMPMTVVRQKPRSESFLPCQTKMCGCREENRYL